MQDLLGMIATRNRPPMLVRAARFGIDHYNRAERLPRLLKTAAAPRLGEAIVRLLDLEQDLEIGRTSRAADYSIALHVDVLTALMGEARLLRASAENVLQQSLATQSLGASGLRIVAGGV